MEIILIVVILVLLVLLAIWPKPDNSVAIVSLIKDPHQFETWFNYHKFQMKIDKFYIFTDEPDEKLGVTDPSLILIQNWKDRLGFKWDDTKDEPANRNEKQRLAFEEAQRMAEADGVEWLIHIDSDELLHGTPPADVFSKIKSNSFKIKNWEMAPDSADYKNCFIEGSKFHTNVNKYIAYINGKSACRVGEGTWGGPHDIHSSGSTHEIYEDDLKVLHYPSCNISETMKRANQYGKFKDDSAGWSQHHKETRDVLTTCEENCPIKAREQFQKRMADGESTELTLKFV